MARYRCSKCGYIYDEKMGDELKSILPGTNVDEISCPGCSMPGFCFNLIESEPEPVLIIDSDPEFDPGYDFAENSDFDSERYRDDSSDIDPDVSSDKDSDSDSSKPHSAPIMPPDFDSSDKVFDVYLATFADRFDSVGRIWNETFSELPMVPYNLFKILDDYKDVFEDQDIPFSWKSILWDLERVFYDINKLDNPKEADYIGMNLSLMKNHVEFARYLSDFMESDEAVNLHVGNRESDDTDLDYNDLVNNDLVNDDLNLDDYFVALFAGAEKVGVRKTYEENKSLPLKKKLKVFWDDYFHYLFCFSSFPHYFRKSNSILNNPELNEKLIRFFNEEDSPDLETIFDIFLDEYPEVFPEDSSMYDRITYICVAELRNSVRENLPAPKKMLMDRIDLNFDEFWKQYLSGPESAEEVMSILYSLVLDEHFFDYCMPVTEFMYCFENLLYCVFQEIGKAYGLSSLTPVYVQYIEDGMRRVLHYRKNYLQLNSGERMRLFSYTNDFMHKYLTVSKGSDLLALFKDLFEELGFEVEMVSGWKERGGELVIERNQNRKLVRVLFSSVPVSEELVRDVPLSKEENWVNTGMVISNSKFTDSARELAEEQRVQLVDGEDVKKLLEVFSA